MSSAEAVLLILSVVSVLCIVGAAIHAWQAGGYYREGRTKVESRRVDLLNQIQDWDDDQHS